MAGGSEQWWVCGRKCKCARNFNTLKKTATKVVRRRKRFSIERLKNDYRTTIKRLLRNYYMTFQLRCGNFILTATVLHQLEFVHP